MKKHFFFLTCLIIFSYGMLIADSKMDEKKPPLNSSNTPISFGYFTIGIDTLPVLAGLSLGGGYRYLLKDDYDGIDFSLKYTSCLFIFNELDGRIFYLHYPNNQIKSYFGIGGSLGGFLAIAGCGAVFGVGAPLFVYGYQFSNSNFLQFEIGYPFYFGAKNHRRDLIPIKIGLSFNFAF